MQLVKFLQVQKETVKGAGLKLMVGQNFQFFFFFKLNRSKDPKLRTSIEKNYYRECEAL